MSKTKPSSIIELDELRYLGHPGTCDEPGCSLTIERAIAERIAPECHCGSCADGEAAIAAYCTRHVAGHHVATLADVTRNAGWRPGRMWQTLHANWPHPVTVIKQVTK